jgi:hypothetical protein
MTKGSARLATQVRPEDRDRLSDSLRGTTGRLRQRSDVPSAATST